MKELKQSVFEKLLLEYVDTYIQYKRANDERKSRLWWSLSDEAKELFIYFGKLQKDYDALRARIAELEAEVEELKPFRDGYDPEEVFPPEGEWVWLRDCDDEINPVQYDHKAGIYWNYETNVDGVPFRYWEFNNGDLRRWYPIGKLPEA